jgi:hypothetical protein
MIRARSTIDRDIIGHDIMNSYDRHQLTARDFEREDVPPALWVCTALIALCAGLFFVAAVALSF